MRGWLSFLAFFCLTGAVDANESALRTWAVLADRELMEAGVADLVTVGLSKQTGIETVTRIELETAGREWEYGELVGPDDVAARLRAGRTLTADALLLLRLRVRPQPRLEIVVTDCVSGARLRAVEMDFDSARIELAVDKCLEAVAFVQSRYPRGVEQLFGIPPFLSRDLVHRYDVYQTRWQTVLSDRLSSERGVAVIEIEEAAAILDELQLTGGQLIDRVVPLIVSGEYQVHRGTEGEPSRTSLSVNLISPRGQLQVTAEDVPLANVRNWIERKLAAQVLDADRLQFAALDPSEQQVLFVERAEAFTLRGELEHATGLREAALLLEPRNTLQRARLIHEYQRLFRPVFDKQWHGYKLDPMERRRDWMQAIDRYERAMRHLEYLIRQKRIHRDEALDFFRRQRWHPYRNAFVHHLGDRSDADRSAYLARVFDIQQQFIDKVFPSLLALPPGHSLPEPLGRPDTAHKSRWDEVLFYAVMNYSVYQRRDAESLEIVERMMRQYLPPQGPSSYYLLRFFNENYGAVQGDQLTAWLAFLKRISNAEHPLVSLYGRIGLLLRDYKEIRRYEIRGSVAERTLERFDRLVNDIESMGLQREQIWHAANNGRDRLRRWIDPMPLPDSPRRPPTPQTTGRLKFHPLTFLVEDPATKSRTPYTETDIHGMTRCGDQFDAWWTKEQFFLMHEPGVLKPLPLRGLDSYKKYGMFSHVTWDGECLWLVVGGRGIYVLQRDGSTLAIFDSSTEMPPISAGLQMLPLGPRRMLAVGALRPNRRVWCGVLEVSKEGDLDVQVFHEATREAKGRPQQVAEQDIHTVFSPGWIHRFRDEDGKEYALVGRGFYQALLCIDLETLQVSTRSYRTRGFGGNQCCFSHQGNLYLLMSPELRRFSPGPGPDVLNRGEAVFQHQSTYRRLLEYDGWLHVPGVQWKRLEVATQKIESMLPSREVLAKPYRDMPYYVSAHFGIVGYRPYIPPFERGAPIFYRVEVAAESKQGVNDETQVHNNK